MASRRTAARRDSLAAVAVRGAGRRDDEQEQGSIIVVVATDAPLLPHQLKRVATRVSLGHRTQGGFGGNGSGDIFIAFSTANPRAWHDDRPVTDVKMLPNDRISPLFQATAQATEAAITNALLAAETMTGANDLRVLRDAGRSHAGGDEEVRATAVTRLRTSLPISPW